MASVQRSLAWAFLLGSASHLGDGAGLVNAAGVPVERRYKLVDCADRPHVLEIRFDYLRADVFRVVVQETLDPPMFQVDPIAAEIRRSDDLGNRCFQAVPSGSKEYDLANRIPAVVSVDLRPALLRLGRVPRTRSKAVDPDGKVEPCSVDTKGCKVFIEPVPQG